MDSAATVNVYFASHPEWDKPYTTGKNTRDNVSIGTDPATEEGYLPLFLPVDGRTAIKYNDQVYILKTSGDVEIVVNNLMTEIALSDGDRYKEYEEFIARLEAELFDAMGDRDSQED